MGVHWKDTERRFARALRAERIVRGDDFSASEPDVVSDRVVVDTKSYARMAAITLYRETRAKYEGMLDGRLYVLGLHVRGRPGDYALIRLEDLAELLEAADAAR